MQLNHGGTQRVQRVTAASERNDPNIFAADNADEADKGRHTAEAIREIRAIRGEMDWNEIVATCVHFQGR